MIERIRKALRRHIPLDEAAQLAFLAIERQGLLRELSDRSGAPVSTWHRHFLYAIIACERIDLSGQSVGFMQNTTLGHSRRALRPGHQKTSELADFGPEEDWWTPTYRDVTITRRNLAKFIRIYSDAARAMTGRHMTAWQQRCEEVRDRWDAAAEKARLYVRMMRGYWNVVRWRAVRLHRWLKEPMKLGTWFW